jgi:hypothetical protein
MSWADRAIAELQKGNEVVITPHGNSMMPLVYSGAKVTLAPCSTDKLEVGDIVLCRVAGSVYLHLVSAKQEDRVQISNNRGHVNGWTKAVYGKAIKVDNS